MRLHSHIVALVSLRSVFVTHYFLVDGNRVKVALNCGGRGILAATTKLVV